MMYTRHLKRRQILFLKRGFILYVLPYNRLSVSLAVVFILFFFILFFLISFRTYNNATSASSSIHPPPPSFLTHSRLTDQSTDKVLASPLHNHLSDTYTVSLPCSCASVICYGSEPRSTPLCLLLIAEMIL